MKWFKRLKPAALATEDKTQATWPKAAQVKANTLDTRIIAEGLLIRLRGKE